MCCACSGINFYTYIGQWVDVPGAYYNSGSDSESDADAADTDDLRHIRINGQLFVSAPPQVAEPPALAQADPAVADTAGRPPNAFCGPFAHAIYQRASGLGLTVIEAAELEVGDVKCVYHPASGKQYEVISAETFQTSEPAADQELLVETWPHRGFDTRDDFELAEFMLDARLNTKLSHRLFQILNKALDGESSISLRGVDQLNAAWEIAGKSEEQVRP